MAFNSLSFAAFLPVAFALYWAFRHSANWQNAVVVLTGFCFYGWTDFRLCGLLGTSVLLIYLVGIGIERHRRRIKLAKALTIVALLIELGALAFFKYCNFFIESFVSMLSAFEVDVSVSTLRILLPIGISFHTFAAVSYILDIHAGKISAERNLLTYGAYMLFFPQLLAGPIQRAPAMVPQFSRLRIFEYPLAVEGCRQMLWGLFKKMVVADGCASFVGSVFSNVGEQPAFALALGALLYSTQVYADFSGYSDIAIGCGKLFGIRLQRNFAYPYFATNIADFWRRWHISLTTWFRDYLYIPLGGNRCSLLRVCMNTLIVFTISGLWHGAAWTFVLWGMLHGLYFLPYLLTPKNIREKCPAFAGWMLVLSGAAFAWILFRAPNFEIASDYYSGLFFGEWGFDFSILRKVAPCLLWSAVMFGWELLGSRYEVAVGYIFKNRILRWSIYLVLSMLILMCYRTKSEFVYFQF